MTLKNCFFEVNYLLEISLFFTRCFFRKNLCKHTCSSSKISMLGSGTDVMIFRIFSPKNLAKKLAFFAQTTASFCKNCDNNIGF
jgi:hypothetical protein